MSAEVLKRVWPEWQIEGKPLGRGSFGVVYKAVRREHNVESLAAIKEISIPSDASEIESLRSEGLGLDGTRTYLQGIVNDFVSEIQLMESLKGVQNIVSVEDYKVVEKEGEIGWEIYIRMELLTSFNAHICDRKMTEEEVIKLGCDICSALEICAKRNIIHRDIKPENIFINDFGHFKLGDFGIARKMENMSGGLSQKGTYNYMAPEVAKSTEYDARVDIYSLGIVLYRLMNANRLPFLDTEQQLRDPNERRNAVDRRMRGEPLPPPCEASPAMAEVIGRACAYDPEQRFASASEMKQALLQVAEGTYKTDPARTVLVRKGRNDPDRTVTLRNGPADAGQVGSFGDAPKKKSKAPLLIAVGLAVAVLVGAAALTVPKLLGGQKPAEDTVTTGQTLEERPSETGSTEGDEAELIGAYLSEAQAFADRKDYVSALAAVNEGLLRYPQSEELLAKRKEYTDAAKAQIKEDVLSQAAELAASGDYAGAMQVLMAAQADGEDPELQAAYEAYRDAYIADTKAKALAEADKLAAEGDHLGAIALVEQALEITGQDPELTDRITQYGQGYIAATVDAAQALAAQGKYDDALELLEEAAVLYPDSTEIEKAAGDIEDAKAASEQVSSGDPNQTPIPPKSPVELDISGGKDKAGAVEVQREDLHHSSFTTQGQVEWFKFTTSKNYSAYSIEILNNSINCTVYFTIYDAYDNEIKKQSAGKGDTAYLDVALSSDTEYWVKVHRYYDDRLGNYQFSVKEKICDAGMTEEEAFALELGMEYTKSFDARGLCEWYTFKTTTNYATYQFRLMNNSVNTTVYLAVYDEYDTQMGDMGVSKGDTGVLDLKLSPGRVYTVKLSRYYDDRNGYYQMSLHEMICDSGLTQEEAFGLEVGQLLQGTADTSFAEWYSYTFTKGKTYTLKLTNSNVDSTMYATVYDALGTELGKVSASKNSSEERSFEVEAGTVLYIKITRYYADRYGNYSLLMS